MPARRRRRRIDGTDRGGVAYFHRAPFWGYAALLGGRHRARTRAGARERAVSTGRLPALVKPSGATPPAPSAMRKYPPKSFAFSSVCGPPRGGPEKGKGHVNPQTLIFLKKPSQKGKVLGTKNPAFSAVL